MAATAKPAELVVVELLARRQVLAMALVAEHGCDWVRFELAGAPPLSFTVPTFRQMVWSRALDAARPSIDIWPATGLPFRVDYLCWSGFVEDYRQWRERETAALAGDEIVTDQVP